MPTLDITLYTKKILLGHNMKIKRSFFLNIKLLTMSFFFSTHQTSHRCNKNIGHNTRPAFHLLFKGFWEEPSEMAELSGCNTKAMVTALDSTKMDFIPQILVFFTPRRKATPFAAWFVLTNWCYIVCCSFFVLQMSAFSQGFWNNDIIWVFIFFF